MTISRRDLLKLGAVAGVGLAAGRTGAASQVVRTSASRPQSKAEDALATFRRYYPGRSEDIEQAFVIDWAQDPWAKACEPVQYPTGQLPRFWPKVIEPEGRIQFVGAYADNLNWGMEAATRSANRVAKAIDQA